MRAHHAGSVMRSLLILFKNFVPSFDVFVPSFDVLVQGSAIWPY